MTASPFIVSVAVNKAVPGAILAIGVALGVIAVVLLARIFQVAVRAYWLRETGVLGDSPAVRKDDVRWFVITSAASIIALATSIVLLGIWA